jgi:hypothetical protein
MTEVTPETTESRYHEEFFPPFLPVLVLVPFLLPVFWKYHVDVSEDFLDFGYSMVRKSVALSQIQSATPIPDINGLTQWGGWGIRYNLAGEIGYIVTNGPGVRIRVSNGEQKEQVYVFNCKDPDKICSLLR